MIGSIDRLFEATYKPESVFNNFGEIENYNFFRNEKIYLLQNVQVEK